MAASTNGRLSQLLTNAPGVEGKKVSPLNSNSQESINHLIKSIVCSTPDQHDPFYVLDLGAVEDLYHTWTKNLPSISPFYAVKCNPDPVLIGSLAALGTNFDCASHAEIESVLALGIAPDRIIYANPCKAELHIGYARSTNVNLTTFDSSSELYKMKMNHPNSSLLLRIKPPVSFGVRQSFETKYGAFDDEVQPLLETARSLGLSNRRLVPHWHPRHRLRDLRRCGRSSKGGVRPRQRHGVAEDECAEYRRRVRLRPDV